jgi:N-methylhydantoinase A
MEGDAIPGPVIVEERETTIFVLPGWTIRLHPNGSLIADKITEQ